MVTCRGRGKTVCARGACRALLGGPSTSPLDTALAHLNASQLPWRKPWWPVTPERAQSIEAELRRELIAGHVLFEKAFSAIGRRQDQDDFLFALTDERYVLARVHLTFAKHTETDPRWPQTDLFESVGAWEERLALDVLEFGE